MQKSENIEQLAAALVRAQREAKAPLKNCSNDFFSAKYADLSEVLEACKPALVSNGLALVQWPEGDGEHTALHSMLVHESGQWLQLDPCVVPVARAKDGSYNAQGFGSAITYARRYTIPAILGVASEEDDDGEAAVGRGGARVVTPPTVKLKKTT